MRRRARRAIAVAVVAATAALAAAAVPGDLEATPSIRVIRHPFGMTGSGVVQLTNRGTQSVTVGSITFACNSTMTLAPPVTPPFTLAPSASRMVVIQCPSNLPLGMQRCTFTANDSGGLPLVSFFGACETDGMPLLAPAPASHDFGQVAVGSPSAPFTFDVRNDGAMDVALLQLQLDNPSFQIGMPCNPDAPGCDASGVGPISGSATPITVSCKPVRTGMLSGLLYVIGGNGFHIPAPISVTCEGVPSGGPALSIMPPSVDVGPVEQLEATAGASVAVSNAGSGMLGITSIQIVDAGVAGAAGDWSPTLSGTCTTVPCNLSGGQILMVDLTFDPSEIGARGATMIVGYNDGSPKTTTVPLDGIGRGATLELVGTQTTLDFGVLPLNTPRQVTFKLANTGNRTLTDATAVAMPAGAPFVVPTGPITVTTAAQTTVTLTCQSATAGMFSTTLRVSAPDVASLPIELTLKCEVRDTPLFTDPSSIQLGELRTGSGEKHVMIRVLATGAPIPLASAVLATPNPNLVLTGPMPMTTPAVLDLAIEPTTDGTLETSIVVTAASGSIEPVAIPITGTVVTASYTAPAAQMFGTFCVGQPTTSGIVTLTSTGTATIGLTAAPALMQDPSPYDLAFTSPTSYPAMLGAGRQASIEVTPKRRASPGLVEDNLVWTTDVAGMLTLTSNLQATFIDAGVAVAPTALVFGQTPIHLDVDNAGQITLRNCDAATIPLGRPEVPVPFSMDSPRLEDFPKELVPGETTTFRVGFHPTKLGRYEDVLEISSPRLDAPLRVMLVGEGITGGGSGGDDGDDANPARSSFYACGGCGTNHPSSWFVPVLVCVLAWRRRRRVSALGWSGP
jgi:hypothetical protein